MDNRHQLDEGNDPVLAGLSLGFGLLLALAVSAFRILIGGMTK